MISKINFLNIIPKFSKQSEEKPITTKSSPETGTNTYATPSASQYKAYCIPYFCGNNNNDPKIQSLSEVRNKKNLLINEAISIIKNSHIIETGKDYPGNLEGTQIKTDDIQLQTKVLRILKEKDDTVLFIENYDNDELISQESTKLFKSDKTKISAQISKLPVNKCFNDLDEVGINDPSLKKLLGNLTELTKSNQIQWAESYDFNSALCTKTKYKNYNIYLLGQIGDMPGDYSYEIAIAKIKNNKKTALPALILKNADQEEADEFNKYIHKIGITPYEQTDDSLKEVEAFEIIPMVEKGFLNKNYPEDIVKTLEQLGFERKKSKD